MTDVTSNPPAAPKLDPRRHAYREDLAAASLSGQVRAPRYAEGTTRQVVAAQAPVRIAPSFRAPLATEALHGERVIVYDVHAGWAWVQLANDDYVGYTPIDHLSTNIVENTHKVRTRGTFVYPAPDIKTPPVMLLSFGSQIAVDKKEGPFFSLARGGYVYAEHAAPADEATKDFVRVAERLVGTPYLWGGKTSSGLDCSGLVQLSVHAAGLKCPRDTDMQEQEVGEALPQPDIGDLKRGDLLFWKGHVAIAQSPDWLIHASGHQMETVIEPVKRAVERISKSWGGLSSIRRIKEINLG